MKEALGGLSSAEGPKKNERLDGRQMNADWAGQGLRLEEEWTRSNFKAD